MSRPEPLRVLMCSPDFFKIVDVKNIHMTGNSGKEDYTKAVEQWFAIYGIYKFEANSGNIASVEFIKGVDQCEDMVFCANQSFPWLNKEGKPQVIMSHMKYPSRQKEVPYFETFYDSKNYQVLHLTGKGLLEGMGDLIPVPFERTIFGGYGHRTDMNTLKEVEALINCSIIPLKLINDAFYHLDTCFIPLNNQTALVAKEAFDTEGYKMIKSYFKEVIDIPYNEAASGFALNAHIVNGSKYPFAIIQQNNPVTTGILESRGFKVYQVDSSEFMKSGGSVFCMKMMFY